MVVYHDAIAGRVLIAACVALASLTSTCDSQPQINTTSTSINTEEKTDNESEPQRDDARFNGDYDAFRKAYKKWNKQAVKRRKVVACPELVHPKPTGPVPRVPTGVVIGANGFGCDRVIVECKRIVGPEAGLDELYTALEAKELAPSTALARLMQLVGQSTYNQACMATETVETVPCTWDGKKGCWRTHEGYKYGGKRKAVRKPTPADVLERKRLLALLMVDAKLQRLHDPAVRLDQEIEQSSFLAAADAAGLLNLPDWEVGDWLDDLSTCLQGYHAWYSSSTADPRRDKPREGWRDHELDASDVNELAHIDASCKLTPDEALRLSEACERRQDLLDMCKDTTHVLGLHGSLTPTWSSGAVDGCLPDGSLSTEEKLDLERFRAERELGVDRAAGWVGEA